MAEGTAGTKLWRPAMSEELCKLPILPTLSYYITVYYSILSAISQYSTLSYLLKCSIAEALCLWLNAVLVEAGKIG